jgi:hypothetical protein
MASSADRLHALTGESFRKLIENLLGVPYRALRKPPSQAQMAKEEQRSKPAPGPGPATKKL